MKSALLCAAFVSALACAQTPEHPNTPVFRSGAWIIVRSVHAGEPATCTGFYRAHPHVQLGKDTLVIQMDGEVKGVSFGFDDQPMGPQRPLSASEQDLKGVALSGEDFSRLAKSRKVRIDAVTAQGTVHHELELDGLPAALENINAGCPMPAPAPAKKPVRHRKRH